jgi:hypothetical protein
VNQIIPIPKIPITVRPGTMEDLAFIDQLQKKHTKQVGFMQTKALEGKIKAGHVLVAEERKVDSRELIVDSAPGAQSLSTIHHQLSTSSPVGYLIGNDQYFKHDDVGVIYQINIAEGKQRSLVGAMLLKAQFERSAYGCKLYCCWCAQDIEANRFWEACGFVPLAFRAGSEKKQRIHIFWCKRIREGDTTTPWWFPAETKGGSMMEDRLVFPIPPGTHWSDAKPIVLPRHTLNRHTVPKQLESDGPIARKAKAPVALIKTRQPLCGGLMFQSPAPAREEKPKRQKREKIRNDPKFVSAARELRDRWLEQVNAGQYLPHAQGKYDVSRAIEVATMPTTGSSARLLEAA